MRSRGHTPAIIPSHHKCSKGGLWASCRYGTASIKRIYGDWTSAQHRCVTPLRAFRLYQSTSRRGNNRVAALESNNVNASESTFLCLESIRPGADESKQIPTSHTIDCLSAVPHSSVPNPIEG
jgi:hypothetical protein